jgi:hypothetical protein
MRNERNFIFRSSQTQNGVNTMNEVITFVLMFLLIGANFSGIDELTFDGDSFWDLMLSSYIINGNNIVWSSPWIDSNVGINHGIAIPLAWSGYTSRTSSKGFFLQLSIYDETDTVIARGEWWPGSATDWYLRSWLNGAVSSYTYWTAASSPMTTILYLITHRGGTGADYVTVGLAHDMDVATWEYYKGIYSAEGVEPMSTWMSVYKSATKSGGTFAARSKIRFEVSLGRASSSVYTTRFPDDLCFGTVLFS